MQHLWTTAQGTKANFLWKAENVLTNHKGFRIICLMSLSLQSIIYFIQQPPLWPPKNERFLGNQPLKYRQTILSAGEVSYPRVGNLPGWVLGTTHRSPVGPGWPFFRRPQYVHIKGFLFTTRAGWSIPLDGGSDVFNAGVALPMKALPVQVMKGPLLVAALMKVRTENAFFKISSLQRIRHLKWSVSKVLNLCFILSFELTG